MTHDELLARIGGYDEFGADYELVKALRAVVELHKPTKDGLGCSAEYLDCHSRSGSSCDEYCNTYVPYPCRTIQAIEKEL